MHGAHIFKHLNHHDNHHGDESFGTDIVLYNDRTPPSKNIDQSMSAVVLQLVSLHKYITFTVTLISWSVNSMFQTHRKPEAGLAWEGGGIRSPDSPPPPCLCYEQ